MRRLTWMFLLAFSSGLEAADSSADKVEIEERVIMGWIEGVVFVPWGLELEAKLDSGATTSSLHAKEVEQFEKEGKDWVRFIVDIGEDGEKEGIRIERPLVRDVQIRRHEGKPDERPVVKLEFCLNGKNYEAEFSLVDRGKFNYPVLLGRRFLKKIALIDPRQTHLTDEGWNACLVKYRANNKTSGAHAQVR
jgi:hypothetical protein